MATQVQEEGAQLQEDLRLDERSLSEELQLNIDELASSLVELYQVLSPLVQQTQALTAAVDKHTQFMCAWAEFVKTGAQNLEKTKAGQNPDTHTQEESPMET